jgi:hypothetical protein
MIEGGDTELLDVLLAHGANINATTNQGKTVFHLQLEQDEATAIGAEWLQTLQERGLDFGQLLLAGETYWEWWRKLVMARRTYLTELPHSHNERAACLQQLVTAATGLHST